VMNPRSNSIGHEVDEGNVRGITFTGLGLAIAVAIIFVLVFGIFQLLAHHQPTVPLNPMAETGVQQFPPLPRIQEHPSLEVQQLHQREDHILSTYGWLDKNAGTVRIPIDRAMELQLQRGFPVRKEPEKK
jgi:hypothetical protein